MYRCIIRFCLLSQIHCVSLPVQNIILPKNNQNEIFLKTSHDRYLLFMFVSHRSINSLILSYSISMKIFQDLPYWNITCFVQIFSTQSRPKYVAFCLKLLIICSLTNNKMYLLSFSYFYVLMFYPLRKCKWAKQWWKYCSLIASEAWQ